MNVPYLCGGIFFWILTQYRNSEVTKTQLLSKLLNISKMTKKDLSQDKNFKFYTSRFKNCSDDIFKKSTIIFSDGKNYFSNDFIPESVKLSKVQNGKQDLKTQRPKRCFC